MSTSLDISPISYTNKDFRAVYEELLDLVDNLTERWDPTSTNESDPGLVLLKLKAFIADKLNYNIDKNTLENFPSQATQRGNAQKIYDILGYNMQYYKAATTTIIMRYNKGEGAGVFNSTYTIPAFTQITDDSGTINYVTTLPTIIATEPNLKSTAEVEVIEGIAQDFLINGNNIITVNNLDSDYRLYFTESMIAQNGIFITNTDDNTYWQAVNNLEATQLGQKVFKFGILPVSNTCYLEFPQDAATLFGNGINIKYIVTTGVEGNIGANVLTTLTNDLNINNVYESTSEGKQSENQANLKNYTFIIQNYSATNGQDPESLKSAYRNCQKTIDTFNTLVTTQDYENAIYNSGVVSNVVVGDRTNDLNYSYKVVNKTIDGDRVISLNTGVKNGDTFTPNMTAFDLAIYALKSTPSVYDATTFNNTFQTSSIVIEDAQAEIENYKSIQHDYIDTIPTGIEKLNFIFKNFVSLNCTVLTYQKITDIEAKEIKSNINKALYFNYNARKIDFGKELNYDSLKETILNADERIKDIVLEYPEYELKLMKSDNSYEAISSTKNSTDELSETQLDILAKSILAGVTPYCIFNNDNIIDYSMDPVKKLNNTTVNEYGEVSYGTLSDTYISEKKSQYGDDTNNQGIAAITTSTQIGSGDTLLKNENIFCVGPSYVTKAKLSTCLYYAFVSNQTSGETTSTYIITKYYKQSYNAQSGKYIRGDQITKEEFDSTIDKNLVTKESKIVDESEYNSTNESEYITKEISSTMTGPKIQANSYYVMRAGEALYVSESVDKNGNLILDGTKKSWIYRGSNPEENILCPTMEIQGTYSSNHLNYINLTNIKSSGNLGTSDQIEILGENKVQINESGTIYAAWSVDNLYNQLFNEDTWEKYYICEDEIYSEKIYSEAEYIKLSIKPTIKIWGLKTLLQNNDIFIYTNKDKQDLMLLGSGTEISIESDQENELTQQFQYYSEKQWSMQKLNISSINSQGLNSSIEWNLIPTGLKLFVAEKQIISLGEGTKVIFNKLDNKSDEKITNKPKIADSTFNYQYQGESSPTYLPSIAGNNTTEKWRVFSRLQLTTTQTQGQLLNESHQQAIVLYNANVDEENKNKVVSYEKNEILTAPQYITTNNIVALPGGVKQNSAVMTSEGEFENSLIVYTTGKSTSAQSKIQDSFLEYYKNIEITNNSFTYNNITFNITTEKDNNKIIKVKLSYTYNDKTFNIDAIKTQFKDKPAFSFTSTDTNQPYYLILNSLETEIEEIKKLEGISSKSITVNEFDDYVRISISDSVENTTGKSGTFEIELSPQFNNSLLPILFSGTDENLQLEVKATVNTGNTNILTNMDGSSSFIILGTANKYLNYYKLNSSESPINKFTLNLNITGFKTNAQITLFNPLKIKKENEMLSWCTDKNNETTTSVKAKVNSLSKVTINSNDVNLFDYSYQIDEEDLIQNPLEAESFFRSNHIYNKYIISQLDTGTTSDKKDKLNIRVAKQSLQSYSRGK